MKRWYLLDWMFSYIFNTQFSCQPKMSVTKWQGRKSVVPDSSLSGWHIRSHLRKETVKRKWRFYRITLLIQSDKRVVKKSHVGRTFLFCLVKIFVIHMYSRHSEVMPRVSSGGPFARECVRVGLGSTGEGRYIYIHCGWRSNQRTTMLIKRQVGTEELIWFSSRFRPYSSIGI